MKSLDFAVRRKVILERLPLPYELKHTVDTYVYNEWTPTFIYALPPGKVVGYAYHQILYIQNNVLYPYNIKLKWDIIRCLFLNPEWMVMECNDGIVIYNIKTNKYNHVVGAQFPCIGESAIYWLYNSTIHFYYPLEGRHGWIEGVKAIHLVCYNKVLVYETPDDMKMVLGSTFLTYCVSIHHIPDGDFYEPCIVGHDGMRNSGSFFYQIDGIHRTYQYKHYIVCETGSTYYLWNVKTRQVLRCEITDHDLYETDNGFYAITENSLNVYC